MPIDVSCPKCRQRYQVSEKLAGRRGTCRKCGGAFQVPGDREDALEEVEDELTEVEDELEQVDDVLEELVSPLASADPLPGNSPRSPPSTLQPAVSGSPWSAPPPQGATSAAPGKSAAKQVPPIQTTPAFKVLATLFGLCLGGFSLAAVPGWLAVDVLPRSFCYVVLMALGTAAAIAADPRCWLAGLIAGPIAAFFGLYTVAGVLSVIDWIPFWAFFFLACLGTLPGIVVYTAIRNAQYGKFY